MRQSQAISLNALCVLFTVKKAKRLFKQPGQSLCYQLSSGICFESVCDPAYDKRREEKERKEQSFINRSIFSLKYILFIKNYLSLQPIPPAS